MCGVNGASPYVNNSSISSDMHVTGYGNVSTVENFNDSSIARKRNLSNQDPYYTDNPNSEIKRLKNMTTPEPKGQLDMPQNRLEHLILQLSSNLCNVSEKLERRIDELENNFEQRITDKLTDKISNLIDTKIQKELNTVRTEVKTDMNNMQDKINSLEKTVRENTGVIERNESTCKNKLVIKNLKYDESEKDNNQVTINKIHELFKDGLALANIQVESVTRKESKGQYPGVVICEIKSPEDKTRIFKKKNKLKDNRKYSNVYIENDKSVETRNLQASLRTVLKEIGKEKDYKIVGNRLIKKL